MEKVECRPDRIAAVRHPEKVKRRPDRIAAVRHPEKVGCRSGRMAAVRHPEKVGCRPDRIATVRYLEKVGCRPDRMAAVRHSENKLNISTKSLSFPYMFIIADWKTNIPSHWHFFKQFPRSSTSPQCTYFETIEFREASSLTPISTCKFTLS